MTFAIAFALALLAPRAGHAEILPWQTQSGVGPSDVDITLDLICVGGGIVCALIDQYADTQIAMLSGGATIDVNDVSDTIQFQQDSTQDLGGGPIPAYSTLNATNLTFAEIPLTGTPQTESAVLFATTNPAISVPGLDRSTPGDYPFSGNVDFAMIADVVGDLDALIPELVSTPGNVAVSGVLRVLGSGAMELRDTTGSLNFQDVVSVLGESVTVSVTADLTLNLQVDPPPSIPALSPRGLAFVVALMIGVVGLSRPFARGLGGR